MTKALHFNEILIENNNSSVDVEGIILPSLQVIYYKCMKSFKIFFNLNIKDSNVPSLVPIESTRQNMRKIALAVLNNYSIFIEGPPGSGKSALVEEIASITGHKLLKYQIDEFMDNKVIQVVKVNEHY